jgi:hypothetical protein
MINAKELIMYKDPSDHQIQPDVESKTRVNNETANNNNNQVEGVEGDESDNEGDIVTGAQHQDNGTQDNNDQEDHEMFSADKLLKLQTTQGKKQFLAKWSDGSKPAWEPEEFEEIRTCGTGIFYIAHKNRS